MLWLDKHKETGIDLSQAKVYPAGSMISSYQNLRPWFDPKQWVAYVGPNLSLEFNHYSLGQTGLVQAHLTAEQRIVEDRVSF